MRIDKENFWGLFFILMCCSTVIGLGFGVYRFNANTDLCHQKGGRIIDTPSGYVCAKIEKIELKASEK